jgi:hypothetical protein
MHLLAAGFGFLTAELRLGPLACLLAGETPMALHFFEYAVQLHAWFRHEAIGLPVFVVG